MIFVFNRGPWGASENTDSPDKRPNRLVGSNVDFASPVLGRPTSVAQE
jgi:hypothetical protein